jgi:ABC-2 type transport system ATP-binding protein
MLNVENLHKRYGDRQVVDGVSFLAAPGEVIGLLGPNGAGKTTTVSMICGLVQPGEGRVTIGGREIESDASEVKRRLGLVPQDLALYEDLSARGNLELFGALYGLSGPLLKSRCDAALELVGLSDRAKDKPSTFSGGMKRRLNIACALVHDPDVLLLDEPTVGVDPQSRNAIFDNLETLKARGKTLVYTTHYMEEAERLCDRIVIMDHGKVVASDTLANLYRKLPAVESLTVEVEGSVDTAALSGVPGVTSATQTNGSLSVGISNLGATAPVVLAWLRDKGHAVHRVASGQATLEDVFLALTGRQLRD